jgi:multiple sugar transport system permease protein
MTTTRGPGIAVSRMQGLEKSKRTFAYLIVIPAAIYMLFWNVIPYLWVLVLSLFDYSAGRAGGPIVGLGGNNPFVGLRNFLDACGLGPDSGLSKRVIDFHRALKNTLLFAALDVPINICISLPLAVMVNKVRGKGAASVLRTVFFLPVITSSVGVGIMWSYIFHPQQGILNGFLSLLSGHPVVISWLQDASFNFLGFNAALFCILVAYLWADLGYNFIIFMAALQNIPESILEAAELDGAVGVERFRLIVFPLLKPQIMLTSVLTAISAFQVFDLVQVMCPNAAPDKRTVTLIYAIFDNAFRYGDMGFASMEALAFFAIVFVVSLVQRRLLRTNWEY